MVWNVLKLFSESSVWSNTDEINSILYRLCCYDSWKFRPSTRKLGIDLILLVCNILEYIVSLKDFSILSFIIPKILNYV